MNMFVEVCGSRGKVTHVRLASRPASGNAWYAIDTGAKKTDRALIDWLEAYAIKRTIPVPTDLLDFSDLTPFHRDLLGEIGQIPFGTTISYRDLAEKMGNKQAARAVGTGCKKNPYPLLIPCHRVIRSDGTIGEFLGGTQLKKELLAHEGVSPL
ncbi:MAG: hypothetical protein RL235_958 [Chlamydiota bacterium]|jgi:methylated-DNA-[protein]-cysteine S-methyltransferase